MLILEEFAELQLSSASEAESDNAICPKCGAAYAYAGGCGFAAMGVTGGSV